LKKVRLVLFASVLLGVLMAVWGVGASVGGLPYVIAQVPLPAYVWAAQCVVVFGLGAYFMDVTRFYPYGVLYALPFPLAIVLAENTSLSGSASMALTFGLAGGSMVLVGLILFVRFLRRYPAASHRPSLEDVSDVEC
jgi:hypothetical protein